MPASTNQEHRETEGEGKWKKKRRLAQGQAGTAASVVLGLLASRVSWELLCSLLVDRASSALTDLKFRWGWRRTHGPKELRCFLSMK